MAAPGHEPMNNTDPQHETAIVLESADPFESARVTRTSVSSLPYYKSPPRPPIASMPRPPERVSEMFFEASAADDIPIETGATIDVAMASFGSVTANVDTHVFEVVLGTDDRVRVSRERMRLNPWRQICALRIVSESKRTYVGTGWFIAPGVLATAGHCVYLQDDGGWATSIRVIPAKWGPQEPFLSQTSRRFASVRGWVKERKRDFDYGVIFLDDPSTGAQVGNFAVEALAIQELKGIDGQVSGYPADRDRAEYQYFHMRPLTDVTDTRLVYEIDTFGGQSGSPIWQETEERGVLAIGIHTTGGLTSNSGTRITEDVLDNLIRWTE